MTSSGEPPCKRSNKSPSSSSLPIDLILEILSRVPRRYQPILSCVSKNFANLVRSPEIIKNRHRLDLESLYICFVDNSTRQQHRNWFTLRRIENDQSKNRFDEINVPSPSILSYSSVIAIGPEIFFICGTNVPSSNVLIFDSRTSQFRRGPDMLVSRYHNSVGLVCEKVYVVGGDENIEAESFDLKRRVWEVAIAPRRSCYRWSGVADGVLDRKVYTLCPIYGMAFYDTRDGSYGRIGLPSDKWWRNGVCVIENVMYVYYDRFGLMWFDSEMMLWRVVDGLMHLKMVPSVEVGEGYGEGVYKLSSLDRVRSVGMGEYYGKLALLWMRDVDSENKDVWCRMIALDKSGVGIRGVAEPAQHLKIVPKSHLLQHCLSVSD